MLGVFLEFLFFNFGDNNKQAKLTFSYMNRIYKKIIK